MKNIYRKFFLVLVVFFTISTSFAQDKAVIAVTRGISTETHKAEKQSFVQFSERKTTANNLYTVAVKGTTVAFVMNHLPLEFGNSRLWNIWVTFQATDSSGQGPARRYKLNPDDLGKTDDKTLFYSSTIRNLSVDDDNEGFTISYLFEFEYKGKKDMVVQWPPKVYVINDPRYPTVLISGAN